MAFTDFQSILSRNLRRNGIDRQVRDSVAIDVAARILHQILGEEGSPHVRPVYIRYKTLHIACLSPSIAIYIGRVETMLIEAMNEAAGKPIVERIRVLS